MFVIKHQKIFLTISAVLVAAAIVGLSVFGFKVGIDFKGGSLTEVAYTDTVPELTELESAIEKLGFGDALVQPAGENGGYVKTRDLSIVEKETMLSVMTFEGKHELTERSFTSIGPSVGEELRKKTVISLILVGAMIIFFIAYAFRGVSKPVSSWRYGLIAIVTLIHDVILTAGVFALLSNLIGVEADTLFVVALLTVLGLSVNDTIVVFDRVRENIQRKVSDDFRVTVGKSLEQTMVRSLNTSLSTIIVLLALFFVGPESTRIFAITLASGMFFGTYSSIFVASPLLVLVEKWQRRKSEAV